MPLIRLPMRNIDGIYLDALLNLCTNNNNFPFLGIRTPTPMTPILLQVSNRESLSLSMRSVNRETGEGRMNLVVAATERKYYYQDDDSSACYPIQSSPTTIISGLEQLPFRGCGCANFTSKFSSGTRNIVASVVERTLWCAGL